MDSAESLVYLLPIAFFSSFVTSLQRQFAFPLSGLDPGQGSRLLRLLASLFRHPLLLGPTGLGAIFSAAA